MHGLVGEVKPVRRRGFTLIELTVVVAIVSILLSIVMPAVMDAREKVLSSVCLSNLKQIGLGVATYSIDNNDYVMPASFGETDDGYINHFINYMICRQGLPEALFKCPDMRPEEMFDPDGHDPLVGNKYTQASYIMNIIKPGNWSGAPIISSGSASGWCTDAESPVNFFTIAQPSSKLHIMDAIPSIANSHSGVNHFQRTDHGTVNDPPTGMSRWVGNFHMGAFNSVYGDGHANLVKRSEPINWAVNR